MLKVLNSLLVIALLSLAFWLYQLEYRARIGEDRIAALKARIEGQNEAIRLLRAEWSHLSRPQRIEALAAKHLTLRPLQAGQVVAARDIATAIPEFDRFRQPNKDGDPIAALLKELQ